MHDLPETLWHYTSAEAIVSILTQRSLRATNLYYMNDASELLHAAALALGEIDLLISGGIRMHESIVLQQMREMVSLEMGIRGWSVFVSSFCEDGDSLSQWRAYCRSGGFSIGLPAESLRDAASEQGFRLEKCIYDRDQQKKIVSKGVAGILEGYREETEKAASLEEAQKIGWRARKDIRQWLCREGPLLKQGVFEEEGEWRLVSERRDPTADKTISFTSRGNLVVPFCLIAMPLAEMEVRVIVGPSRFETENTRAIENLMMNLRINEHTVESSRAASYREI